MAFPLPAKILLWFFLNLVFVAIVAAFVVQGQFRFGLDSLLAGRAGERLQAMSELVLADLNSHPQDEWTGILKRYADAYQVQIAAVRGDCSRIAGTIIAPPPEVVRKILEAEAGRGRPVPQGPPLLRGGREERPGDFREGQSRGGQPRDGQPREKVPDGVRRGAPQVPPRDGPFPVPRDGPFPLSAEGQFRDGPPPALPGIFPGSFPKFILRAGDPAMYWIGVRMPPGDREARRGGPPALLIAVPSLRTGGLLLDFTPWLWIGAGVLVGSALLWLPLVRGITRSVKQMTGAAGQMAQGQFETRVDTNRSDELGRLGESLNHMAGRLGEYVTGQKRFLGDIAHELCSPLARMEMALGVLEQQAGEKQQGYVNDVREEVRHMSSLVNELLSFSKAGLRAKEIALRAVPLAELCARVIAREAQENADVVMEVDRGLKVLAEPDLLSRAIGNVLRNAIRYSAGAGPIVVSASTCGADVAIAVADSGPGVPEEALHRLFDPFYRPETARTREGGGAGLGLAIVKSCVEACGGSVTVKNRTPSGLEVEMTLRRSA